MTTDPNPAHRRRRAGLNGRPATGAGFSGPSGEPRSRRTARTVAQVKLRRRRASAYRNGHQRPRRRRLLRALLIVVALFSAIGATAIGVVFAGYNIYKSQLPDATSIVGMEPPLDTYVYDAAGTVIQVFHDPNFRHAHVPLSDMSRWVKLATIDVEDRHFYEEGSWDLPRLVAAGVNNITHNGATQGASTITQQLAKISLPGGTTPQRTVDYKVKEIVLGNEIGLNFSKDQVLEMYLNRIYYGNHATGIETAAELFFHKSARDLDLAQASLLAGLPRSPGQYNPFTGDPKLDVSPAAKDRQGAVLEAMVANGDITRAQYKTAYAEKLDIHLWSDSEPPYLTNNLSFLQFLESWLQSNYGSAYINPGGWRIYTTLDPTKQALAAQTVHEQVNRVTARTNMHDGSLVSIDPKTGAVLAMVGAANFDDPYKGQVNMATEHIIPGSTIKLFTYTAGIASGRFTMTTPIVDAPYGFPLPDGKKYYPLDYDRGWHGTCVVKTCLGNSFNMPAVKVEYATGVPYITDLEYAMGVKSIKDICPGGTPNVIGPAHWSATLGSLSCGISLVDLADGAATIANMGIQHDAIPVTKIIDIATGNSVFQYNADAAGKRVVPNNVAYIMAAITSNDNNRLREFGPHGYLTGCPEMCDRRFSAKTGTADFFLDNLTVGWTPDLLTAVWVGNGERSCLKGEDRGSLARAGGDPTYPWTTNELKRYHLQPAVPNSNCGHLDGIVSGYSGAAPIWHQFMVKSLANTPKNWYTHPPDVVANGSGDNADFYLPTTQNPGSGCIYWGSQPDPNNSCTYVGPSAPPGYVAPTPPPTPPPAAPGGGVAGAPAITPPPGPPTLH
jgi:membrane peptidoglycan carboxypeptidase